MKSKKYYFLQYFLKKSVNYEELGLHNIIVNAAYVIKLEKEP